MVAVFEDRAARLAHREGIVGVAPVHLLDQPLVRPEIVSHDSMVVPGSDTLVVVRILAIPVKSLARAKTRLGKVLSPMERAALTLAMLEDVLDAAVAQPAWETWVISPDEAVLEIAVRRGVRPLQEEKAPLSAAVRQVEIEAAERDADALAVVLADLPLLTPEALEPALKTLGSVVLAPSVSDGGTTFLLRR